MDLPRLQHLLARFPREQFTTLCSPDLVARDPIKHHGVLLRLGDDQASVIALDTDEDTVRLVSGTILTGGVKAAVMQVTNRVRDLSDEAFATAIRDTAKAVIIAETKARLLARAERS